MGLFNTRDSVTTEQVDMVSFAARGTLLHDTPPFEQWSIVYLKHRGLNISEDEIKAFLLETVTRLNEVAEDESLEQAGLEFLLDALAAKYFDSEQVEAEARRMKDAYHASVKVVIPQTVFDLCEQLKARGYRLSILSNQDSALIELLRLYHLLDLFDAVLVGSEIGYKKPSKEAFNLLLEDCEVDASRCVYVGDRFATDVLGAQRAGIEAVLYDPLQTELKALDSKSKKSQKIVQIEEVRKEKFVANTRVISKLDELLEIFK